MKVELGFGGKVVKYQLFQPLCVVAKCVDIANQTRVCRNPRVGTPFLSRVATVDVFILFLNQGSAEYEGGDVGSTVGQIISRDGTTNGQMISQDGSIRQLQ